MRWSFLLTRISGIEVRVHLTFLLLPAFFGLQAWLTQGSAGALKAVIFVCLIFLCVLLHEFGHAYAALGYGIRTPDITLLPIGGLARLERMPEKPSQELAIALAGPFVNVVIAAALWLVLGGQTDFRPDRLFIPNQQILEQLFRANVVLVVFNLIPAFPMDGGRVLRALLATQLPYGRATRIAANLGQAIAICMAFIGISSLGHLVRSNDKMLILMAFFIYLAAEQEADFARLKDFTRGLRLQDAMLTEFKTLRVDASLGEAAALATRTTQFEFPVVESDGQIRGLLTRTGLLRALQKNGPNAPVADHMHRKPSSISYFAPFTEGFDLLQSSEYPALAVVDRAGRLVGLVTPESLEELMKLHTALGRV